MTPVQRAWGLRFWLITVAAVAAILVTAALGRWQLSRAAQKQDLQSLLDQRAALPPIDNQQLRGHVGGAEGAQDLVHRAVLLQGRWVPEDTVYLDNRQMQGRPGFFVLTPLRLEGSDAVVLVQRGWVPRNFQDRQLLPPVQTAQGMVQLAGRIAPPPSRLYEFQGPDSSQGSSRIRQNLDLTAFRTETGLALMNLSVLQTGPASEGLQRDWPVIGAGVDKHYGYAFQWFGLSGLIALLYVWFQFVRRFLRPRSRPLA
ncbi:MAG: SURF1 family protein [Acidovorax soli]|uniref:SURF1 family protein n=1 Tax=Acidovorax soli TaxID=592050 RepID=UPI0026F1D1A9|nr:SURF1 family protein [Acidovorax soli]MCM2346791.1 SURF1 family protein [Acidovorax soli]